jgi:hypothetical protein
MKTFISVFALFFIGVNAIAQTPQTIMMDNNKISAKSIKPELQLLFPDYQSGRVILKNLPDVKCQLNYNFLLDEILFIDVNGNKMALANQDEVLQVFIGTRLFIPSPKGYFEVIENGIVSLIYKWNCNIVEKGKEGALGVKTDAPSVVQMNQISFDAKTWKLDVDKEALVTVEVIPFLKAKSKLIPVKGAKDFYKAFPGRTPQMKAYLLQNPVDFKKEADLRRFIKYCYTL